MKTPRHASLGIPSNRGNALAAAQAAEAQPQLQTPSTPQLPPVVPTRTPSTTIDALEREFQKKKERELKRARQSGGDKAEPSTPHSTGEQVDRNDKCPCGSGKKYKACHGLTA